MSRSGYSEDLDNWSLIRWRGRVASATRGKRGQKMLRDLLAALDAMPEKRLTSGEMIHEGDVCALGALAQAKQKPWLDEDVDCDDTEFLANEFDVAEPLVKEIVFENDEAYHWNETPEHRWQRMRAWVASQIRSKS
jgi:hypothetical protein